MAQLTDIVRQYLEIRFALPASRLTTEEFLHNLEKADSPLSEKDRKFLKSFLVAADVIKFAGFPAEAEVFRQTLTQAEKLILETKIQNPELQKNKIETEDDHGF